MSIMPVSQYPNGPQLMANLPQQNNTRATAPAFGNMPTPNGGFHQQPGGMPIPNQQLHHPMMHGAPPHMLPQQQPIIAQHQQLQQHHQQPVYVMVTDQKGLPPGLSQGAVQPQTQMLNPQAFPQQQPVYVVVNQPPQAQPQHVLQQHNSAQQQQPQQQQPQPLVLQAPTQHSPVANQPHVLLPGLSVLNTPTGPPRQTPSQTVTNTNSSTSSVANTPRLFDFDAEKNSTGRQDSTCGPSLTSVQSAHPPRAPCDIGTPNLVPFSNTPPPASPVVAVSQLEGVPQLKLRKSKETLLQEWAEVKLTQHKSRRSSRSKSKKDKTLENYLNTMKCFVRHIAEDSTEEDLFLFASQYGNVKGLIKKNEFGGTLHCAFITFDCVQSANHFADTADGSTYFSQVDALIHKQNTGEEKDEESRLPPLSVRMAESLEDRAERVKRRQIENALARAAAAQATQQEDNSTELPE